MQYPLRVGQNHMAPFRTASAARSFGYSNWLALTALTLFLVAPLHGCTKPDRKPNIVFVLVDTLRADHLGTYGYERETTPFTDELGARGLVFEHAIAQSPWTLSSMASLFTSRYASELGATANEGPGSVRHLERHGASGLPDSAVTLAEILEKHGYGTLAVSTNVYASSKFGILQGFDRVAYEPMPADQVIDRGLALLREHDGEAPFFLYLHFIDVHQPTKPPDPYAQKFPTIDGAPHEKHHENWAYKDGQDLDTDGFEAYRSHKLALYDGALRFIDDQLRRLHGRLVEAGAAEDTVFVVASDHGEEFWDHVEFERRLAADPRGLYGVGHGHSMFPELLRVPLVLAGPGVPKKRVSAQVRNLDLAPTLLGLADIAVPDTMRGVDLVRAVDRGGQDDLLAFSEDIAYGPERKALQDADHRYVRFMGQDGEDDFLFRKGTDGPGLVDSDSPVKDRFRARLEELIVTLVGGEGDEVELDEEARDELRALGYLQ